MALARNFINSHVVHDLMAIRVLHFFFANRQQQKKSDVFSLTLRSVRKGSRASRVAAVIQRGINVIRARCCCICECSSRHYPFIGTRVLSVNAYLSHDSSSCRYVSNVMNRVRGGEEQIMRWAVD